MKGSDLEAKVKQVVSKLCYKTGMVSCIDVLIELRYLTPKDVEDWRFGRVDYLERRCNINLSKLTLIRKEIRKTATAMNLKSSWTAYNKYGKGPRRPLRFSKSGDKHSETAYATHYISVGRIKKLKEMKEMKEMNAQDSSESE